MTSLVCRLLTFWDNAGVIETNCEIADQRDQVEQVAQRHDSNATFTRNIWCSIVIRISCTNLISIILCVSWLLVRTGRREGRGGRGGGKSRRRIASVEVQILCVPSEGACTALCSPPRGDILLLQPRTQQHYYHFRYYYYCSWKEGRRLEIRLVLGQIRCRRAPFLQIGDNPRLETQPTWSFLCIAPFLEDFIGLNY